MPATREGCVRKRGASGEPGPATGQPDGRPGISRIRARAGRSMKWPGACGLQSRAARALQSALAVVLMAGWSVAARGGAPARIEPAGPLLPPLEHMPLDPPLRVTGTFGELRGGHFHAGLDFSTGGVTGRPVYAALAGSIERVRTSGAGYGRSLYLRARDGRLVVMAHLDQFARPVAQYVAAIQDSSGQYEQDLWPEPTRFPVRAGDVLGWSGRSGTVPPHLHFEVRRGDVAYNPLRAGISLDDTIAPSIVRLTLEPLDDTSFVERSAAPRTLVVGAGPDTVLLQGRARAIVEATDGTDGARRTMAPWSVALDQSPGPAQGQIECRFDSASWASDMSEADYVYDRGRITAEGRFSMMLWAPRGFRPVVIDGPGGGGAIGTLMLAPGESTHRVRIVARDVAGHTSTREIVLRDPSPAERGPGPGPLAIGAAPGVRTKAKADAPPEDPPGEPAFDFVALPERHLRVIYRGAPAGSRRVWFETARSPRQPASPAADAWSAILPGDLADAGGPPELIVRVGGEDGHGAPWSAESQAFTLVPVDPGAAASAPAGATPEWRLPRAGAFESALVLLASAGTPPATDELVPLGSSLELWPPSMPLRRAALLSLPLAPGNARGHVALFNDDGAGWEFIARADDPASPRVSGEARSLGRFALFDDTRGPRVSPLRAPRHAAATPYSHWALEARLEDAGSGIDPRTSHFVVGGRSRPSEWDGSVELLRWRPLRKPAKGTHRYEVVAVDRAGNVTRRSATFVID